MTNYKETIKVIGFDLDQTLYPKSPQIDHAIQVYLYQKISDHLKVDLVEAEKLFRDLYKEGRGLSGSKTLEALGVPDAVNSVQEALEKADIADFLKPNEQINALLLKLKEKYTNIDILTGSNMSVTLNKLNHLQIDPKWFNHIITKDIASKSDNDAYILWFSKYPECKPENFLYIGDRPKTDHYIPQALGAKTLLVNQKEKRADVDCEQLPTLLDIAAILL